MIAQVSLGIRTLCHRRAVMFLLIVGSLLAILLVLRYRSGSHYLPVAVEISDNLHHYGDNPQILVVSPFGTTRTLVPDRLSSCVFRSADYVAGPVARIRISGVDKRFQEDVSVSIVLGSSVGFFLRNFEISPIPIAATEHHSLQEGFVEYVGESTANSVLTIPSICMNWQGDLLLLVICMVQAVCGSGLLLLLFNILLNCWRRFGQGSTPMSPLPGGKWIPGISRLAISAMAAGLLLILSHQLWSEGLRFFGTTDVGEHLIGLMLLSSAVLLLKQVSVPAILEGLTARWCWCCGFLVMLVLLRLLVSGGFPWFQTGDYASYWRFGGLMSRGEWGAINDGYLGTEMMAVRAFLYSFPIRLLAGDSTLALVIVNTFCLVGASVCLYAAMASWFGRREAFIAAILFSLHPDILFGGHLCRHDNPAMLYLAVLFLLIGKILSTVLNDCSVGLWSPSTVVQVICAGLLIGVLEAQRSYLPFLLASLGIVFAAAGMCSFVSLRRGGMATGRSLQRPAVCLLICLLISISAVSVNAMIVGKVRPRLGTTESTRNWRVLASMETRSEQTWLDFVPFCAQYTPQIPESQQGSFFIRKLLYEKLQSGLEFWGSLLQKNSVLSATQSAIRLSGGVVPDETFPSRFHVPLVTLKSTWASGWYCILLCLGIIRLLLIPVMPIHHFEWYPGVFSLVFLAMLLALAEAGQQYDLFLAFPLAVSGARVLGTQSRSLIGEERESTGMTAVRVSSALTRFYASGVSAILGVVVLQLWLGKVIAANPSLTFAELKPVSESVAASGATARCGAALLPVASVGLKKGESLGTVFEVSESDLGSGSLHFFVSGDQRRERLWPASDFTALPLTFSVAIDDQIVCSGPVGELEHPPFVVSQIPGSAATHRIELKVTAEADVSAAQLGTRGHLTVEYVY